MAMTEVGQAVVVGKVGWRCKRVGGEAGRMEGAMTKMLPCSVTLFFRLQIFW